MCGSNMATVSGTKESSSEVNWAGTAAWGHWGHWAELLGGIVLGGGTGGTVLGHRAVVRAGLGALG